MEVKIVDVVTGAVVAVYAVEDSGLNYDPSEEDFFDSAWLSAVEDGLVDEDGRDGYGFELV